MRYFSIFVLVFAFIAPAPVCAQMGKWFETEEIRARLIAGSNNEAALEIHLIDGWHTYWRNPGDSGLPPIFSWADSKNIKDVEVFWPAPTRKKEYEFNTFGFDEKLILPLKLTREKTGKKAKLDLKAQIMICKDICIPQPFDVKLDVPTKGDFTQSDAIIAEAKQKLPHKNPAHGISIDTVVVAQDFLVLSVTSQNGFEGMDVFPVVEEDFWGIAGEPQIDVSEHDPKKAIIKIAAPVDEKNLASAIQEKTLSVTLTHQGQALEYVMEY